jgi:hypothetical protein
MLSWIACREATPAARLSATRGEGASGRQHRAETLVTSSLLLCACSRGWCHLSSGGGLVTLAARRLGATRQ